MWVPAAQLQAAAYQTARCWNLFTWKPPKEALTFPPFERKKTTNLHASTVAPKIQAVDVTCFFAYYKTIQLLYKCMKSGCQAQPRTSSVTSFRECVRWFISDFLWKQMWPRFSHSAVRVLEVFCSPPWADVWRSSSSVTLIISKWFDMLQKGWKTTVEKPQVSVVSVLHMKLNPHISFIKAYLCMLECSLIIIQLSIHCLIKSI